MTCFSLVWFGEHWAKRSGPGPQKGSMEQDFVRRGKLRSGRDNELE
ncbi:hypothetical protein X474_19420 [Dethiosulfatarculus sandiegensis]|uniref:Uncharacterized protein n=1 Tax=Dethiosulfatarculus sandiegensis TaxID=1429043 RepID=A0A0D2GBU8_9BACT|nr:hypothetical protein X474_19420 [Dethiosulfatarculus sandiegensis]